MAPSRLNHANARVAEMRHQAAEKVGRGDEVGVENRDVVAARRLQSRIERAGLESDAVRAVVVLDVDSLRGISPDRELGNALGLVRRIVEHLDFELRTW